MSPITVDDVKKLAKLSALTVNGAEIKALRGQLQEILSFVGKLSEVDTTGIEPTYQVTGLENVWRDDEIIDYKLDREALLKNAPYQQDGQVKVKRVIA